ncbi:hypothetical protein MCETHM1_03448 [Flavobacteriaceae bacterium]
MFGFSLNYIFKKVISLNSYQAKKEVAIKATVIFTGLWRIDNGF